MTRSRAVRVVVTVLVVAAGAVSVGIWRQLAIHSWRARVAEGYVPPGEARAKSKLPLSYWARHDRVAGDILRRERWGAAELEELRRYVALPVDWKNVDKPSEERGERTTQAAVEYLMWVDAVGAIGTSLSTNAPIDETLRPAFEAEIAAILGHESPRARNTAIAEVTEMGLLDHPGPVRSKVEAMRTDPDPAVAANAIRQLEWRDLLVQKGMVK